MNVAFFTRYGTQGASSRVRAQQFEASLAQHGIQASFFPLLSDTYLRSLYLGRRNLLDVARSYVHRLDDLRAIRDFTVVWLEKELLPYVPYWIEARLLRQSGYVIDFDDAIFHTYDKSPSAVVRHLLGSKIDQLMANARLVTAGNAYLAERAVAAGAKWVERLPSVVDTDCYPSAPAEARSRTSGSLRIVWIGSPATVQYLDLVREALERLALVWQVELRVIGAPAPDWKGVKGVSVKWARETEAASILEGDVGIMPLLDTPWERGKCGYKLIQYMACRLPVVASPVGVNKEIVEDGVEGFWAANTAEWEAALTKLTSDPALRSAMGARGRSKVESFFSVQAVAPRFAALLKAVAS